MVIRMWHGRVAADRAREYRAFLEARAIPDYRSVEGNLAVRILERLDGDVVHFITMTTWRSRTAIAQFAGEPLDAAKYYPEDREFLLEFEPTVVHYDVVAEVVD